MSTPFLRSEGEVLNDLGVRADEQAPKTWFEDLVAALRFVELAGEVPQVLQLHGSTGIANVVKEAALAAAARSSTGVRRGRQAPPMLLAVIARVEGVVVDESASSCALLLLV